MTANNIFIPTPTTPITENWFNWNYEKEQTVATTALFYITSFPGSPDSWNFLGMTGTDAEGNVHGYILSIDKTEGVIEQTFDLESGLFFRFFKSVPAGEAFGRVFVAPDSAELAIRLDPTTGIAEGDYNATFKSNPEAARLAPQGTFKLNLYAYIFPNDSSSEEMRKLHAAPLWK